LAVTENSEQCEFGQRAVVYGIAHRIHLMVL
jgi:hypothetical protein